MPKLKPHKGVLDRAKITGTGKVRFNKPGKRHLNGHLSGKQLRTRSGTLYAKAGDIKRLEGMLHTRLTPSK
jgi:large subunit ribosomal protein L35